MTKEGLLALCKEHIEKVKKGELSLDDFYNIYKIYLEEKEKEEDKLESLSKDYEDRIIAFKREFVGIAKKLREFELMYTSIIEEKGQGKYIDFSEKVFEKQIKEYDEMQKIIKERKKNQ